MLALVLCVGLIYRKKWRRIDNIGPFSSLLVQWSQFQLFSNSWFVQTADVGSRVLWFISFQELSLVLFFFPFLEVQNAMFWNYLWDTLYPKWNNNFKVLWGLVLGSVLLWKNSGVGSQKRKVSVVCPTLILKSDFQGIRISFHALLQTT